jgi:hypothetical protein
MAAVMQGATTNCKSLDAITYSVETKVVYSFVANYCVIRIPHLLSHVTVQLATLWLMGEQNTS